MDFLAFLEYVIKKGRLDGHRYGKRPGDKAYFTANELMKRYKKKHFQGIHDGFMRDPEFRSRMIENHREEELCRRMDALADENHTHNSIAQAEQMVASFKQARFQCYMIDTKTCSEHKTTMGTEFFFHMVELARFMVDFLFFRKSRDTPSIERCDLLIAVFGKIFLDKTFLHSTHFVTDGAFTADVGLL